jgi:hypothetical protein
MQLRHISPRSSDWVDAMDEGRGGQGWEKLAPEELTKLRQEQVAAAQALGGVGMAADRGEEGSYGWGDGSASR